MITSGDVLWAGGGLGWAAAHCPARVVNAVPQNSNVRVGMAFDQVAAAERERLDVVLVDAVLKQFGH